MKVVSFEKTLRTRGRHAVVDVTDEVAGAVRASGVQDGVACVYSPHTTCCFRLGDGAAELPEPAPFAPASGMFPIRNGELLNGPSRRLLFVELDRERERSWLLQIVGD
ncbi:MAG TPA: hypothetical protein VF327_09210 [Gaiellaceae bacterium]|jgi:thiamine phosphate synthase YjbQ (UPF0047 family)